MKNSHHLSFENWRPRKTSVESEDQTLDSARSLIHKYTRTQNGQQDIPAFSRFYPLLFLSSFLLFLLPFLFSLGAPLMQVSLEMIGR